MPLPCAFRFENPFYLLFIWDFLRCFCNCKGICGTPLCDVSWTPWNGFSFRNVTDDAFGGMPGSVLAPGLSAVRCRLTCVIETALDPIKLEMLVGTARLFAATATGGAVLFRAPVIGGARIGGLLLIAISGRLITGWVLAFPIEERSILLAAAGLCACAGDDKRVNAGGWTLCALGRVIIVRPGGLLILLTSIFWFGWTITLRCDVVLGALDGVGLIVIGLPIGPAPGLNGGCAIFMGCWARVRGLIELDATIRGITTEFLVMPPWFGLSAVDFIAVMLSILPPIPTIWLLFFGIVLIMVVAPLFNCEFDGARFTFLVIWTPLSDETLAGIFPIGLMVTLLLTIGSLPPLFSWLRLLVGVMVSDLLLASAAEIPGLLTVVGLLTVTARRIGELVGDAAFCCCCWITANAKETNQFDVNRSYLLVTFIRNR